MQGKQSSYQKLDFILLISNKFYCLVVIARQFDRPRKNPEICIAIGIISKGMFRVLMQGYQQPKISTVL